MTASAFRLTGWHVLAGFVVFFGAVIAVDAGMMTLAYRTHPGEVSVTPGKFGWISTVGTARSSSASMVGSVERLPCARRLPPGLPNALRSREIGASQR